MARTLYRNPATRRFVRAVPMIAQRTVGQIARQVANGRPITGQMALRTLAGQTLRVLRQPGHVQRVFRLSQWWVRGQVLNAVRHARALRPFRAAEFGTQPSSPTEAHIAAANDLIRLLRKRLVGLTVGVRRDGAAATRNPTTDALRQRPPRGVLRVRAAATRNPTTDALQRVVSSTERAHAAARAVEKVWDFYLELFGQRPSPPYVDWLLGCDRIATDRYQAAYLGVGAAKKLVPAPPPFSYMRTGFSPATFRRGVKLTLLGKQVNPFPLVRLPYHRLVNSWTLGAVLHEVSHNPQSDLGLNMAVPRVMARALLGRGRGSRRR